MMNYILFTLLGSVVCSLVSETELRSQYQAYKLAFNKEYSAVEDERHFRCFARAINLVAGKEVSHRWGITEWTDRCGTKLHTPNVVKESVEVSSVAVPTSVDWRTKGVVGPVLNQGMCGAPEAFGCAGNAQSMYAIAHQDKFVELSVAELVECPAGNSGCQGGTMENSWNFVLKNGLCTAAYYPFTAHGGREGPCNHTKVAHPYATFTKLVDLKDSEPKMTSFCAETGPFAAGLNGVPLQTYQGGIITGPECSHHELDHVVLVIGYGVEQGVDYWIAKNSWGLAWGEEGYFRLERGVNCLGIANDAASLLAK